MKLINRILFLAAFLSSSTNAFAQSPQGINFQAVVRDANGDELANQSVSLRMSILENNTVTVYQETHTVTTNGFGLLNLVIGQGAITQGVFSDIDWSTGSFFAQSEVDVNGGSNYQLLGSQQLMSVPYALYAESAGGINGGLMLPTITTDAVTDITSHGATLGGDVTNANGNQILFSGVVHSTSPNPTIFSDSIIVSSGVGAFSFNSFYVSPSQPDFSRYFYLLSANTTYYVRAYAVTESNTVSYGNEVSFTTLSVGQTGPGGGLVFFDKGNNIGGWQYLEAAPSDQSTDAPWGCTGTLIGGTSYEIGTGESNTSTIVAGCNEPSFAAKLCDDLVLGGQSDWFLPSAGELILMRPMYIAGQGNLGSYEYWSSTERNSISALFCDFANNAAYGRPKDGVGGTHVRAVRAY